MMATGSWQSMATVWSVSVSVSVSLRVSLELRKVGKDQQVLHAKIHSHLHLNTDV